MSKTLEQPFSPEAGGEPPTNRVLVFKKKERHELTPFERSVQDARILAEEELSKAETLEDFLLLTDAIRNLTPKRLKWADSKESVSTAEEWLGYLKRLELRKQFEKEAKILEKLLRQLPTDRPKDKIQIVIAKVADLKDDWNTHRLLGVLPQTSSDVGEVDRSIVYFKPTSACCLQAAAEVLGDETVKVVEADLTNLAQLAMELDFAPGEAKQNFRYRDEKGNTVGHRSECDYLLFGLMGGFSNEEQLYQLEKFLETRSDGKT